MTENYSLLRSERDLTYADASFHSMLITDNDDVKVLLIDYSNNILELLFRDVKRLSFERDVPYGQEMEVHNHNEQLEILIKLMDMDLKVHCMQAYYRYLGLNQQPHQSSTPLE